MVASLAAVTCLFALLENPLTFVSFACRPTIDTVLECLVATPDTSIDIILHGGPPSLRIWVGRHNGPGTCSVPRGICRSLSHPQGIHPTYPCTPEHIGSASPPGPRRHLLLGGDPAFRRLQLFLTECLLLRVPDRPFFPPPSCLFTVAQARRSASPSLTPPASIFLDVLGPTLLLVRVFGFIASWHETPPQGTFTMHLPWWDLNRCSLSMRGEGKPGKLDTWASGRAGFSRYAGPFGR